MSTLVVGAGGMLGGRVARLLLAQGRTVRALSRTPDKLEALRRAGAEVVRGDLLDPASLARACTGMSQVFTTANSFVGKGSSAPDRVDRPGNRNLIDAGRHAGVDHVVFTSAFRVAEMAAVDYFAAKVDSERYLQQSGLAWTVLRPTAFMEIWGMVLGEPVLAGRPVRIVGDGRRRANYIAVDDVAAMVPHALDRPSARNRIIEFGGPERLSPLDIVKVFERIAGRPAKRQHAPAPVIRALAAVLRPFNPVLARQLRLVALFDEDEPALDMAAVLAEFPIPQTRLEDWARARYGRSATARPM